MNAPKLTIRYHVDYRYKEKKGHHEFHANRVLTGEMLADTVERHIIDEYGKGVDRSQISILDYNHQEIHD